MTTAEAEHKIKLELEELKQNEIEAKNRQQEKVDCLIKFVDRLRNCNLNEQAYEIMNFIPSMIRDIKKEWYELASNYERKKMLERED